MECCHCNSLCLSSLIRLKEKLIILIQVGVNLVYGEYFLLMAEIKSKPGPRGQFGNCLSHTQLVYSQEFLLQARFSSQIKTAREDKMSLLPPSPSSTSSQFLCEDFNQSHANGEAEKGNFQYFMCACIQALQNANQYTMYVCGSMQVQN